MDRERSAVGTMRICFFTKYPPAMGIDSFSAYWLARDLARAGHRIYIISNCWELETGYRIEIADEEKRMLEESNVELFSTFGTRLVHREQKLHGLTDRLVNIALITADRFNMDLLVAFDFFPFGVAGFYAKLLTFRPMLLRINYTRALRNPQIGRLIEETLRKVEKIEIREQDLGQFLGLGVPKGRITFIEDLINPDNLSSDAEAFDFSRYTDLDTKGKPLFTFIDDPEPYSKLYNLIRVLSLLKDKDYFLCIQLSGETTPLYGEIQDLVKAKKMERQTIFIPPQPPWRFASLMNASTCLIYAGNAEEYRNQRLLVRVPFLLEALYCGKCVILSRGIYQKSRFSRLCDGEHILLYDTASELRAHLESLMENPEKAQTIGSRARNLVLGENDHRKALKNRITMFEDICGNYHAH
jgi:glycosyltransferase involved in cell wall biosynthesis